MHVMFLGLSRGKTKILAMSTFPLHVPLVWDSSHQDSVVWGHFVCKEPWHHEVFTHKGDDRYA
jgi:hypothetical protein